MILGDESALYYWAQLFILFQIRISKNLSILVRSGNPPIVIDVQNTPDAKALAFKKRDLNPLSKAIRNIFCEFGISFFVTFMILSLIRD